MSENLLYDWNKEPSIEKGKSFVDETLRDGMQGASLEKKPNQGEKRSILRQILPLNPAEITLGFPASKDDSLFLAKQAKELNPTGRYCFISRTLKSDVEAVLKLRNDSELENINLGLFVGASPIRRAVENWELDKIISDVEEVTNFAVREGLDVSMVTEDTTRSIPGDLKSIYQSAIDNGANSITIADTVGAISPRGIRNLLTFLKDNVIGEQEVSIDFHGHNDRGLATINSLEALLNGADRVHMTALGIGERAGNTKSHEIILGMYMLGMIGEEVLSKVVNYSRKIAQSCGVEIPFNEPIIGKSVFSTETGIHASAIRKALQDGEVEMADLVYSSVPASKLGRNQNILIGPNSGKVNVLFVCERMGITPTEIQINRILEKARKVGRHISDSEIEDIISRF